LERRFVSRISVPVASRRETKGVEQRKRERERKAAGGEWSGVVWLKPHKASTWIRDHATILLIISNA
jgi:hypothetical protein